VEGIWKNHWNGVTKTGKVESLVNTVKVLETAGYDTNMTQSASRRGEGGSKVIEKIGAGNGI
jgi:hypothetical protein